MSEYNEMMAAHDALDGGVYLVEVFLRGEFKQHGIFSSSAKVLEWIHSWPSEYTCVSAPFVLDEPDYGNVKKEAMQ